MEEVDEVVDGVTEEREEGEEEHARLGCRPTRHSMYAITRSYFDKCHADVDNNDDDEDDDESGRGGRSSSCRRS